MKRLCELNATELVEKYSSGDINPVDVIVDCFARINEADDTLHAIFDRFDDEAIAAAQRSARRWEAGLPLSAMDGVPVTIKENQAVAGRPTPLGSAAVTPIAAEKNSPVVDRLINAGVPILARTTMPELGMLSSGVSSLHPLVRNPWNIEMSPGGSSAGAGAASAAGYAPMNLGSDIGGSVRLPASWCGVTGFKPSYARVPVDPPYPGRTIGPMGRKVADLARSMTVLAGPHLADPWSLPEQNIAWQDLNIDIPSLNIGLVLDIGDGAPVQPEIAEIVLQAAETFAAAGAEIVEIRPYLAPGTIDLIDKFWRAGHWRNYQKLDSDRRRKLLPFIDEWCRGAAKISSTDALEAHDSQITVAKSTLEATKDFDLILSPVSPGPMFPSEWPMPSNDVNKAMEHIGFCVVYNMSGQPAVSINGGFTESGSPVGVQIAAGRHADRTALAAAAFFEDSRPAAAFRAWPQFWDTAV